MAVFPTPFSGTRSRHAFVLGTHLHHMVFGPVEVLLSEPLLAAVSAPLSASPTHFSPHTSRNVDVGFDVGTHV